MCCMCFSEIRESEIKVCQKLSTVTCRSGLGRGVCTLCHSLSQSHIIIDKKQLTAWMDAHAFLQHCICALNVMTHFALHCQPLSDRKQSGGHSLSAQNKQARNW